MYSHTPLDLNQLLDIGVDQWASCQIRKIAGAHAPGMPGTFSLSPHVSDPDMHHGTCVTHVPWCMPGSLTSGFLRNRRQGKTFPAFPAHAQPAIFRIWQEAHGFKSAWWTFTSGFMSWSRVSFASWSFPSMPQWLGIQQKWTVQHVCLCRSITMGGSLYGNKKVLSVFARYRPQAGHWVRVDHHIVVNCAHVLVIVQCQGEGCSLSSKDGAVVWQYFGQLAADCPTIQEMAVDHCCYPHSLVHIGTISIEFIMWSLGFMILIEFSLGFLSGDHTFADCFNEAVSLGIIIVESWVLSGVRPIRLWSLQRPWLPLPMG